jgi:hypothetical protein
MTCNGVMFEDEHILVIRVYILLSLRYGRVVGRK